VDLAELRDRILQGLQGWESIDVDLTEDSLDITFEKTYPDVEIEGVVLVPDASVTISATIHSPEAGKTAINYDIDITLETESEHLADLLEEELDRAEEAIDEAEDELKELMEAERSAEKAIREAEEEKQELIDEAAEEGVELPFNAFAEFDSLLAQAKSALQAGNFAEAKNLAKRAEKSLDKVDKIIDELEKEKELRKEAEEAIQEAEEEKQEVLDEARKEGVELPPAAFAKFDRLLAQAKDLFARGNYQGAKQLADQAEDALEDVEKEIEKLEKEKEQKEEQAKEEEERKQEVEERKAEEQD
jgi:predicted  nucleic acid-binding Zn-ribbon protein